MWKMYNETKADLTIKLGGESEIDVLELSRFLENTVKSLNSICGVATKNEYFKLNFKSSRQGSVVLELGAITPLIHTLFATYTASDIVTIFLDLVRILKTSKGSKPLNIDFKNNIIKFAAGLVNIQKTSLNLYMSDSSSVEYVKKAFGNIKDRADVSFKLDNNEEIKVSKEEMSYFQTEENEEIEEETIFFEKENVKLISIVLEGKSKWNVKFRNKNIKVGILDKNYLENLQNLEGEEITIHKNIVVDLVLEKSKIGDKVIEKYYITKVYS